MQVERSMVPPSPARRVAVALAIVGILASLALGLKLRLDDPLSSPVLPAEDTYTHMAYVREHLRDGTLDPQNPGGALYPPGLHAYLAAVWVYTGADLYEIMRLGPVLFGGLSILGMAILLWRLEGPVAGFAGALGMALAPEAVLRTAMMAPTALDLALLPFFLLSMVYVLQGRLRWTGPAAVMGLFFVFAHPWLFTIFAIAGALLVPLALGLRWPRSRGSPATAKGLWCAATIVLAGFALSLSGCWGACGPGFRDILPDGGQLAKMLAPFAVVVAMAAIAAAWFTRGRPDREFRPHGWHVPWFARLAVAIGLLVLLAAVTAPALDQGLPRYVNLPYMFGWPVLALALVGLVALALAPTPLGILAVSLSAAMYPFVIYNPLNSPFWPHRTAAYLGLTLMVMAGVGAAFLAREAQRSIEQSAPTRWPAALRPRAALAVVPVLLLTVTVGASMYAAAPTSAGWYRLYSTCEHDALRDVADNVSSAPDAVVITGAWQPKLVVSALANDSSRVWMDPAFFTSPDNRDYLLDRAEGHDTVYVVVERYIANKPGADTAFLDQSPWHEVERACVPEPRGGSTVVAYARDSP